MAVILGGLLLAAACSGGGEARQEPAPAPAPATGPSGAPASSGPAGAPASGAPASTPPGGERAPPARCPDGPALPPPWTAATLDDYVPAARALAAEEPDLACPSLRVDFDGDGQPDTVTLAVDRAAKATALYLVPASGPARPLATFPAAAGAAGGIDRPIGLKPAGERVLREHLADAARLTAPAAVEVCGAAPGEPVTIDTVCYCSTWYWLDAGAVKSATACD